jgi:hypothetical protein
LVLIKIFILFKIPYILNLTFSESVLKEKPKLSIKKLKLTKLKNGANISLCYILLIWPGPSRSQLVKLLPIGPLARDIYSWLFKYTQQHTADFTENSWGLHLLKPALNMTSDHIKYNTVIQRVSRNKLAAIM